METTLHIALEEVVAEAGSILLADPEKEELIFQYSIGDKPVPRGTAIAWDKGISSIRQGHSEFFLSPAYRRYQHHCSSIISSSALVFAMSHPSFTARSSAHRRQFRQWLLTPVSLLGMVAPELGSC